MARNCQYIEGSKNGFQRIGNRSGSFMFMDDLRLIQMPRLFRYFRLISAHSMEVFPMEGLSCSTIIHSAPASSDAVRMAGKFWTP